jgi:hypothetical protein
MVLAWAAILATVIAICAVYGGRDCEVPRSGVFHHLLKGHTYVPTSAGRFRCREVK